jgi:hypothetical protein
MLLKQQVFTADGSSQGSVALAALQYAYRHQGASPCALHAHYAHFSKLARPPKIKL